MERVLPERNSRVSEGYCKVLLLGNVAKDPEFRVGQSGSPVLKVRLACAERYKDRDGEWKDRVEYVNVVLFGKRAEGLARVLVKGSGMFVEGSLRTTSYEKDGQKRYSTDVMANNVLLTGSKPRGESAPRQAPPSDDPPIDAESGGYGGDDDSPF